ncbi:MAG: CHASE domain-containing protein [Akkermansiaceae bacterium]
MKSSNRNELVDEHSSRVVRVVINFFSIPGTTWILLGLSLVLTALVCQQVWGSYRSTERTRFESEATVLRNAMTERMELYKQVLKGVGGLFAASEEVQAIEFRSYVATLDIEQNYPGILALGYVDRVGRAELGDFLEASSQDREGDFFPLKLWPTGERQEYLVIRYVEPLEKNRKVLGYDIASEERRLKAAMRARETGEAILTPKVELVQATKKPGAVLFAPVSDREVSSGESESTGESKGGWVYAAFLVEDMVEGVTSLTKSDLQYSIYDGAVASPESLLCRSNGLKPTASQVVDFSETTTLDICGQPWTVRIESPVHGLFESAIVPIGLLASGGLCMSLLVFGVAHSMATTSRRACLIATEMTAQLRDQKEALKTSEERLSMVIKGSNDGIWDWDVKTNDVYFSPRWKSMLGYEVHEIENNFAAWEALIHPEDKKSAQSVINRYFENVSPSYKLEHRLRHKDGSYRWILARGVAARDESGSPLRMAGSHVDLTELKRAEQNLRKTNESLTRSQQKLQTTLSDLSASHEELQKAQLELIQVAKLESVGTLAAGVAHEVKNPLQIIIMGIDYLEREFEEMEEATTGTLLDMRDAALRADAITRELLQFSKATEFSKEPVQLNEVVQRSVWLIRAELKKAGVEVVRQLADEIPDVLIDRQKIQQVLINLMINSIQAMERGCKLTLTSWKGLSTDPQLSAILEFKVAAESGEFVILAIRDEGTGIKESDFPRIFDPFFTTKGTGSGTGLGLSVVRKIIDLHDASIHLRNLPDRGLEVLLIFPCIPPTVETENPNALAVANSI